MTQQDDITQRVLTAEQDPINAAILLLTEEADSISDCHTRTPGDWAGEPEAKAHYDHVRSVVDALSKLRAPVADERAAFSRAEISFPLTIPENRVYLAGPMSGIAEHNFPAFHAAADRLRGSGLEVVNPADHGLVEGLGWSDYMRWDLVKLAGCHAVYVLPGWEKSKGASLEIAIARALGMPVFTVEGAALASAPVADERVAEDTEVQRVKSIGPAYPYTPNTARPTPLASAPVAAPSNETLRLAGVIADKIEDGTLFQAGIFSRRELADKVRAVVRFAREASTPVAGEAQKPVAWMLIGRLKNSEPKFTLSDPAGIYESVYAPLYAAPQASAENDREGLAHKVNLLTAELLGHRSAAGHLSVLVDELRGHLIDARQVMADFQQAFVPAFDTPETLTMVPNEALAPFCAALDRLCDLDLPQADKDGGQQSNWISDWSAAIKSLPMGRSAAAVDKSPNLQGSLVDRPADLQGGGDDVVLPPLPSPPVHRGHALFAGSQMQTYARAAVLADRQQRAGDVVEPIAWECTTPVLFKYVTDSKYRKFRPAVRKWYRPYRCASCAALSAPQAEQGERDA